MGSNAPNVVWIAEDSVRADHTTMGGYTRDTTPEVTAVFEAYAEEWLQTGGTPVGTAEEDRLTEEMRKQLRDLGYVE